MEFADDLGQMGREHAGRVDHGEIADQRHLALVLVDPERGQAEGGLDACARPAGPGSAPEESMARSMVGRSSPRAASISLTRNA